MSNRLFSTLYDKLAPHTPGCPSPVMLQFVREAAREVCKSTLAWRYEADSLALTADEYTYPYEPPTQAEVCSVTHAALNGQVIPFVTQEQLHARYPDWPYMDATSQPRLLSQLNVDSFVVAPVPDAAQTYTLKLFYALRPKPTATYMDGAVFDELEDVIVHCTLYKLFALPERSWTDVDMANYHKRQCALKITAHRADANLTIGRGSLQVRMIPFGA